MEEADELMQRATRMYRRLGIEAPEPRTAADYREYVEERIDEYLGFDVLALPGTDHADLVRRAVNRIPPFDSKGSGFRDSLLWGNVVELARRGADVALVTADRIFLGDDGQLAKSLRQKIEPLPGQVVVVVELTTWLLETLPWRSTKVGAAVAMAQDEDFAQFFAASDLQHDLRLVLELDDAFHVRRDHEEREGELLRGHAAHGTVGGLVELDIVLHGVVQALHGVPADPPPAEAVRRADAQ